MKASDVITRRQIALGFEIQEDEKQNKKKEDWQL